jgi:hypothetical protein
MTSTIPLPTPTQGAIWFPYAGVLLDAHGQIGSHLIVRLNRSGITTAGQLVHLDEDPDHRFRGPTWRHGAWHPIPVHAMDADQMLSAILLVEVMLQLPERTLSAESIQPALLAAAAAVSHITTSVAGTSGKYRMAVGL